jgi:branched-chain amino acid aminotransferase
MADSLNAAERLEPPGIYTVARTFHGTHALELDAHLKRMEESARLTGIPLHLDRDRLRATLRDLLTQAAYPEARFRITVPRDTPEAFFFAIEPLSPVPPEVKAHGVAVQSFAARRSNPRAKDTRWMDERVALKAQMQPGSYEGLLTTPDGAILEGLGSNFYAILDGRLRTAGAGILEGISRRIVMRVAPDVLPVIEEAPTLADIPTMQEAFLTSSSRGVVPIVQIDGQPIGGGTPGPLTQAISVRYDAWAEAHLEPI